MLLAGHNLNIYEQQYVEYLINDTFPDVKMNNINAFTEHGDLLTLLKNPRVIYFGKWFFFRRPLTPSHNPRVYLVQFEKIISFHPDFVEGSTQEFVSAYWFGLASYAFLEGSAPQPVQQPVEGSFVGYRIELDTVPAPPNVPIPPSGVQILYFDYVKYNGSMTFKAGVFGAPDLRTTWSEDYTNDGCWPADNIIGLPVSEDSQTLTICPADDSCNDVGNPQDIEIPNGDVPRVLLKFYGYSDDGTTTTFRTFVDPDSWDKAWTIEAAELLDSVGLAIPGSSSIIDNLNGFVDYQLPSAEWLNFSRYSWAMRAPNGALMGIIKDKDFPGLELLSVRVDDTPAVCAIPAMNAYKVIDQPFQEGMYIWPNKNTYGHFGTAQYITRSFPSEIFELLEQAFLDGRIWPVVGEGTGSICV